MRRLMKKFMPIILCAVIISIFSSVSLASEINNSKTQNSSIAPYQAVIDKLNKELGTTMSIPDDKTLSEAKLSKEKVYEKITSIPLDKFEADLRAEYAKVKDDNNTVVYINANNKESSSAAKSNEKSSEGTRVPMAPAEPDSIIGPMSVSETILQKEWLFDGYGAVDLESEVFSVTGQLGTFIYQSIINLGYYTFDDRTHFRCTSTPTYVLSNGNKTCTGTYRGSLFTSSGVMLPVLKTYIITYNAP